MNKDIKTEAVVSDLESLCERRGTAVFSNFFDAGEQVSIIDGGLCVGAFFFGGIEGCERKILGVFPEWEEFDGEAFPIKAIRISFKFKKELSHRDYLGSLMGLGIERNRIGDIFVYDDGAVVFLHESIAFYVMENLKKIGSLGVNVSFCEGEIIPPEPEYAVINAVAASERIDAVIAAVLNISRNNSSGLISREAVSVNHRPITGGDKKAVVGDLFSIRGFGRFVLADIGDKTRKDRIHITAKKFL